MKNILVVEDNEENLKLFKDILGLQNYDVKTATDGLEGFEKLAKNSYDLLILDLNLPRMNGFELMRKINNDKIKCPPILVVSAHVMEKEIKEAKALGCMEYITKPIDIMNFLATVKRILNKGEF